MSKLRIIRNMSNEAYHNGKRYKNYLSSSKVKSISKNGMYTHLKEGKGTSKFMNLGSAAHTYFFERDRATEDILILGEDKLDGRKKEGKQQALEVAQYREENPEKAILFPSEMKIVETLWDNFKETYPNFAQQFLDNQEDSELSMFTTEWRGHKAKVRVDHIGETKFGRTIFDLKTTYDDPSPSNFKREVYKYQYDIQDVMYREVAEADEFLFIATKTSYPFTVQIYRVTEDWMTESANLKIRYALEEYERYLDDPTSVLPSYNGLIQGL